MQAVNIAIDGPAGAGKSTIARMLAKKMNYLYVDTGAMYRAMALYFLRNHTDMENEDEVRKACGQVDITLEDRDGELLVFLNGENVSSLIRTKEVSRMASVAAAKTPVRTKLVELQRKIAAGRNVVMDGRDIGTVVLPDAKVKIYLTASSQVRAERRYRELKDPKPSLAEVKAEIEERDDRDMHRKNSPLRRADDAVLIDSSEMTPGEVAAQIAAIAYEAH
ncbi:(d)CMP kinase [Clostridium vitabionis]|uniref:(d)CMP kinase n=1 Tax=Clostridium vitabionis TaxID=2784388 RepID=UPI00188C237F|nr:(d)CMP kinase [Clostridium vitabionis]